MVATRAGVTAGLALATALVASQDAAAADAEGQFGVRGAGLVSCALYQQAREARSPVYHAVAAWMDGYITGVNEYAPESYDVASFETTELLAALVSEHCRKHPATPVFAVVRPIVDRFAETRLRGPSTKVEVRVGDRTVVLYQEVVRRIQQRLRAAGFDPGEVDGVYGEGSQDAMKGFQRSVDLQPTGVPDQLTLWRLFHEAE